MRSAFAGSMRRHLATNLSILAYVALRTTWSIESCEFVIYSSCQFCDWSQSHRLQADGDAVTDASDRVVKTRDNRQTGPCVLVTSLGHWLTRLAAETYSHEVTICAWTPVL